MDIYELIMKGINLSNYKFKEKPLVVGGLALQFYGIREAGHDFDYVVSSEDWKILKTLHPNNINLFGGKTEQDVDATINLENMNEHIDLISTLYQFNHDYLQQSSIEYIEFRIISLPMLLMVKTLAAINNNDEKSKRDQQLIVDFIVSKQYPNLEIVNSKLTN
jgi:hypothetical protein